MHTLVLLATLATTTLVLRSGDRIAVEGPVKEEKGIVTFRSNGLLYSMPATEIDSEATAEVEAEREKETEAVRRLRLPAEERDRLLRELEQNHEGQAIHPDEGLPPLPSPPTPEALQQQKRDERTWRSMSRDYEESVRRAREELELLEQRVEQLQNQIRMLIGQGFQPHEFTYQTSRLVHTRERLPGAQLDVARAERALAQFREDARREGVLPGWLR
jgi:hypothetical protein